MLALRCLCLDVADAVCSGESVLGSELIYPLTCIDGEMNMILSE